jgi:TFIIF-interacting CTD phosphatase-like protein
MIFARILVHVKVVLHNTQASVVNDISKCFRKWDKSVILYSKPRTVSFGEEIAS